MLGFLAAAVLDPERLLWRAGERLISIPPPAKGFSIRDLRGYDRIDAFFLVPIAPGGEYRFSSLQNPDTWSEAMRQISEMHAAALAVG